MNLFETFSNETEKEYVNEVLDRGTYWLDGPEVEAFENDIAERSNRSYAVSFNSGTSALFSVFSCIPNKMSTAGEVIVPSFTYPATANAIYAAGMKPVFTDIERNTLGLDARKAEENINNRTVAICPVHFGGGVCRQMDEIVHLGEEHDLFIIEDAAQSFDASMNGLKAGQYGHAAIFSFSFNKIISTGAGGMMVTSSEGMANLTRQFSRQGKNDVGEFTTHGYNFSMPSINAAVGLAQLDKLNQMVKERQEKGEYLDKRFDELDMVRPALLFRHQEKVYQMYNIVCWDEDYRNNLMRYLLDKDIPFRISYPPVHREPFYAEHNPNLHLPVTDDISSRILTLPFHLNLSYDDLDHIVDAIEEFRP